MRGSAGSGARGRAQRLQATCSSSSSRPEKLDEHPVGRALIWLVAGGLLGAASTLAFPQHFIHAEGLRVWNLAASPAFVAGANVLVAKAREKPPVAPAVSGALFAFAFAVARWKLAAQGQ